MEKRVEGRGSIKTAGLGGFETCLSLGKKRVYTELESP